MKINNSLINLNIILNKYLDKSVNFNIKLIIFSENLTIYGG